MGEWVKEGAENLANIYFKNQIHNADLYLGLIANDIAIDLNEAKLSTIIEPSAATYARAVLSPANWLVYGEVATYSEIEFEVSLQAYGTIYGCFIATSLDNSGKLLAIHKFTESVELTYYGDRVGITPRITIS